jgi:hypothetical protein
MWCTCGTWRRYGSYTAGLVDALTCPSLSGLSRNSLGLVLQPSRPGDLPLAAEVAVRPGVRVIPGPQPI